MPCGTCTKSSITGYGCPHRECVAERELTRRTMFARSAGPDVKCRTAANLTAGQTVFWDDEPHKIIERRTVGEQISLRLRPISDPTGARDETFYVPADLAFGVDWRQFHTHPQQFLGGSLERLSDAFDNAALVDLMPPGSFWHYGPVYENMETIVQTIGLPYREGAARKAAIFVKCRVLSSPFHPVGYEYALPPNALVPWEAVLAERGRPGCCTPAPIRDWRDEKIEALTAEAATLRRERDQFKDQRDALSRKVYQAKKALAG